MPEHRTHIDDWWSKIVAALTRRRPRYQKKSLRHNRMALHLCIWCFEEFLLHLICCTMSTVMFLFDDEPNWLPHLHLTWQFRLHNPWCLPENGSWLKPNRHPSVAGRISWFSGCTLIAPESKLESVTENLIPRDNHKWSTFVVVVVSLCLINAAFSLTFVRCSFGGFRKFSGSFASVREGQSLSSFRAFRCCGSWSTSSSRWAPSRWRTRHRPVPESTLVAGPLTASSWGRSSTGREGF